MLLSREARHMCHLMTHVNVVVTYCHETFFLTDCGFVVARWMTRGVFLMLPPCRHCHCYLDDVINNSSEVKEIIVDFNQCRHFEETATIVRSHYIISLLTLLSPLRACSHIGLRPTPRNAIVVCPPPALRPGPNSTREPSYLAPRTFSTSLLVVPSSCFRRGPSAWLLLE